MAGGPNMGGNMGPNMPNNPMMGGGPNMGPNYGGAPPNMGGGGPNMGGGGNMGPGMGQGKRNCYEYHIIVKTLILWSTNCKKCI